MNTLNSEAGDNLNANKWWNDKKFVDELESRYKALKNGKDKGYTVEQLKASIEKLREEKYNPL